MLLGLATALVALHVGGAPALEPGESAFTWTAPAACPDEDWAREHLASRLDGELPPDLRIEIDLGAVVDGYAATISVHADQPFAPREIVGRDCEALARAAILVVAVAIDPLAVTIGPPAVVAPVDTTEIPPAIGDPTGAAPISSPRTPDARTITTRDAPRPPRRRAPWQHALRLAGGIGSQIVPALTGALQLGYAAIRGNWRIETHASWIPPVTRRYADGSGARVQAFTLAVRGCPSPRIERVALALCVGLVGGPVRGRGVDVPRVETATNGWLAGTLGAAAIIAVHPRLGVVVEAEAHAAMLRPAFHLGTREALFEPRTLGGRALLGLELGLR